METRATIGTLDSIVSMNGVIAVDSINEDIEKALRPRTVLLIGPSYTTFTEFLVFVGVFEADIRNGVRYPPVTEECSATVDPASTGISKPADTVRALGFRGGRPEG